jgi:putative membrane protein
MEVISSDEQQQLVALIKQQELKTTAELVTVVADAADSYGIYVICYALVITAAVGLLLNQSISFLWISFIEVAVFSISYLILRMPVIKTLIVPEAVKKNRARAFSKQCFLELNLHRTEQNSGVMFFVCHFERYVEIIADTGLDEAVDNGQWQVSVNQFSQTIKAGKLYQAYQESIINIGKILAEKAPVTAEKNPDELPNHLVVVSHPYN